MTNISTDLGTRYANGGYRESNPTWHDERAQWKAAQVLRSIADANLSPKSICDIGCGTGGVLAEVVRGLPGISRAVGYEPSPDAPIANNAKGVIDRKREFASASDERFDVALMLDVFEHVEDYYGFLRSCRALAPWHIFHIPLDANAVTILRSGCLGPRQHSGHLHYFTQPTAIATLQDAGYSVHSWAFTKSGWEGPCRNPLSPINLLRRSIYRLSPEYCQRLLGGLSLRVVARAQDSAEGVAN